MLNKKERNLVKDRKYHYTYLITDKTNGMLYYGVHSTDHNPYSIEDYHSSSKILNYYVDSKGIHNFTKQVRRFFSSRELADKWEHTVLRRLKVSINVRYYNQHAGGVDFRAAGYTVLKNNKGDFMRVPVGTDLSSEGWVNFNSGRKCPSYVKEILSEKQTGLHTGDNNNVHKIKDKLGWRLKCSTSSEGKSSPSSGNPSPIYTPKKEHSLTRAKLTMKVNPNTKRNIYDYKGCIYLYYTESPVDTRSKACTILDEKLPDVDTIVCRGISFSSVKVAAKSLGLHTNTIRNRINSEIYPDYYEIPDDIILQDRFNTDMVLLKELYEKYYP